MLLIVLVVLTAGFFVINTGVRAEEGCVTGQCHAKLIKAKNVHPVAEPCDTCHQAVSTPHPKKGTDTFKLTQKVPDLCFSCHTPFGKKPDVHPPVKEGMCTTCHNPHSSDEAKLLTQPVKDICLSCHPDKVNFKYLHGPTSAGDCTACHSPHESDNKHLTLKEGPELCFSCHMDMADIMKKKVIHGAVLSGCPSCHNPHGSSFKKLLPEAGGKVCFQCHSDIGEKIEKAKFVHAPVKTERACASCHSPHSSDNDKLLAKPGKDLCLECHKNIIKKNMKVLHGPITAGKCTPCHDPHGSKYPKMLAKEFPSDVYAPYTDSEYELCFSCHNRDMLRFPDTSFATGFRDGERNLHYLHVNNKEKGRTCRLCHSVHGSGNPKLIVDSTPFGKWDLPLKFVKTETGGSCSPGCHKTQNYDRKTAGKAPEAEKPEQDTKEKK